MKIQAEVCVCDECGNEWIAETDEPERCPSRKCRKRSWDRSGIRLGVDEQLGSVKPEKILKTKPEVRASKVRKLGMAVVSSPRPVDLVVPVAPIYVRPEGFKPIPKGGKK